MTEGIVQNLFELPNNAEIVNLAQGACEAG